MKITAISLWVSGLLVTFQSLFYEQTPYSIGAQLCGLGVLMFLFGCLIACIAWKDVFPENPKYYDDTDDLEHNGH